MIIEMPQFFATISTKVGINGLILGFTTTKYHHHFMRIYISTT